MTEENKKLKDEAFMARDMYKVGAISRSEAKLKIEPYIVAYNCKAVEIAKKYNMKAKKITFAGFCR